MTTAIATRPPLSAVELLREYVDRQSQDAFRRLVDTHVDLIYSAALRQVRDKHLAEEVTQSVFILLARKAPSLSRQPNLALGGWLHEAARLTSKNALRVQARRRHHERKAAMAAPMHPEYGSYQATWSDIYPLLDEGLGKLSERDRAALVLRFFECRSLAETGAALGVSEDAAGMRVSRALDKLREFFTARRPLIPEALALAGLIRANAVRAAPPLLSETSSLAGLQATAISQSLAFEIADNVQHALRLARLRNFFLISFVTVIVVAAGFIWLHHFFTTPRPPPPRPPEVSQQG